jgi:hypothetical protein
MRTAVRSIAALFALALGAAGAGAASPFDDLLRRVPDQANAVLLLGIQAALKSPLGIKENWAQKHRLTFLGGLSGAAPGVVRMAVGAQLNPGTLQNTWEVALIQLERPTKASELVRVVSGAPDSMVGQQVVLSPRNAYFVPFEPRVIGMMRPADRQATARWIRTARSPGPLSLSPYLRDAVAAMPANAQGLMAIDLENVLDAAGLRQRFKKCQALAGAGIDVEQVTKLFTGLKGITLALRVENTRHGELRVDFAEAAGVLAPVAKPLLLEAMAGMGATIEDMGGWQPRVEGKSVLLAGPLSERGVRQILSPLFQQAATNVIESQPAAATLSSDPRAAASQRYFRTVQTLLTDLKQQRVKSYQQISYWHMQFAAKIDALPMLNVDEDLLKYGAAVSTTLRGLAQLATNTYAVRKAAAANAGTALVQGPAYNYYGNGWGWGYYNVFPAAMTIDNYGATNNFLAATGATEGALRSQTWQNIDAATNEIRRKMVEKYQIEFPAVATGQ